MKKIFTTTGKIPKAITAAVLSLSIITPASMLTANAATITYKVKSGDTLSAIAKKYKVSLTSLKSTNKITNANKIKVGLVLKIPSTTTKTTIKKPSTTASKTAIKPAATVKKPAATTKPKAKPTTYKVVKGDTLSKIAKKFGLTVTQLKSYNSLKSDIIKIGQVLKLMAPTAAKPAAKPAAPKPVVKQPAVEAPKPVQPKGDTYKVVAGDTLFLIAKANGLTVAKMKEYNNLTSDSIYAGQVLRLTAPDGTVGQPVPQGEFVDYITNYNLSAQQKANFIHQVAPEAILAWKEYKILPSLTIAQAILESYYGFSWLSVNGNNYFGIKADSSWTGNYVSMPTREFDSNGVEFVLTEKFRKYSSIHESIVDHSKFLLRPRYANIIGVTDYMAATKNIQQDGYATDPNYAKLLQAKITQHNLTQYDVQAGAIASAN
ncbi:LysM peptidoglycan-binding domain-containing protein [Neobacillus mesonae]|uniref:LysM peptidoglycan-binding domain-containing protein n=1 Tax=Neobacillus mesonae TaxID=1193713 RepID=UPI00083162ED|nr:LysM peptidoglycan-binding domain-containing protein [Neobacillus mesonae]